MTKLFERTILVDRHQFLKMTAGTAPATVLAPTAGVAGADKKRLRPIL
jgi:hypothetical protein